MIGREFRLFCMAVMFYTRLPCPSHVDEWQQALAQSRRYFPLIGWIVGAIAALVLFAGQLILPLSVAVVLSMVAGVLVTGAFHEDGFADVCDAFGGGWGREKILVIMKDSRVGAYGALGLVLLLAMKFALVYELAVISLWTVGVALICAHTTSRFLASTMVDTHDYVQDTDASKAKPVAVGRLGPMSWVFGVVVMVVPYLLLGLTGIVTAVACIAVAWLGKWYLGVYFNRHVGGFTGDCLGATQQVTEVMVYAVFLVLWRFS